MVEGRRVFSVLYYTKRLSVHIKYMHLWALCIRPLQMHLWLMSIDLGPIYTWHIFIIQLFIRVKLNNSWTLYSRPANF